MIAVGDPLHMREVVRAEEVKPTIILGASALLVALHRLFGSVDFWTRNAFLPGPLPPPLLMFLSAFLLLGIVPLLLLLSVFREKPEEYGLCLGNWREGLKLTGVFLPAIAVLLLLPASGTAGMRGLSPLSDAAARSPGGFLALELSRFLLFYTAWEFFFRGFMIFGLRPYIGDWLAVCAQVVPSCLWHIGLPTGEMISSTAGGFLFGIMAIRTRSILWPLLLHGATGVLLDLFIIVGS